VLDMSRFLMMIFADGRAGDHTILQPAAVAEMLRVQNADVALDVGFKVGLGWMLSTLGSDTLVDAGPVAHHAGATIHFRSQMYALPEHKLGVIVASNSSSSGRAVDIVAKRALAAALEAKTGIRQGANARSFRPATAAWPDQALQAYVGEYATVTGYVRIVREGRQLKAQVLGREIDLLPGEDGRLGLRFAIFGFISVPLGDLDRLELQRRSVAGRDVLVARIGEQEMLVGERLDAPAGAPRKALVGIYEPQLAPAEYAELEDVRISEDGGRLFAEARVKDASLRPGKSPLLEVSEGEAVVLGPLADSGEVVRWRTTDDGQLRARFSRYEFRRKAK
jgi:hypothetical protein